MLVKIKSWCRGCIFMQNKLFLYAKVICLPLFIQGINREFCYLMYCIGRLLCATRWQVHKYAYFGVAFCVAHFLFVNIYYCRCVFVVCFRVQICRKRIPSVRYIVAMRFAKCLPKIFMHIICKTKPFKMKYLFRNRLKFTVFSPLFVSFC